MIKLYGSQRSRAVRNLWMLEEVGADYELVEVDNFDASQTKSDDYLKINPNGKVPALVDGDLTMFESLAINLYLAKNYGGDLYPGNKNDEALTWQWTIWSLTEVEPATITLVVEKLVKPADEQDARAIETAIAALEKPIKILNDALQGKEYLLGGDFSVADLNVASVVATVRMCGVDISHHANAERWLNACLSREAFSKVASGA